MCCVDHWGAAAVVMLGASQRTGELRGRAPRDENQDKSEKAANKKVSREDKGVGDPGW